MTIKFQAFGILSKSDWTNALKRSPKGLVVYIKERDLPSYKTDVIIHGGDSLVFDKMKGAARNISKPEFETYLYDDKKLVFYLFTYIEYEDFFDHVYNTLLVEHVIWEIGFSGDIIVFPPKDRKLGIEIYRWDL